MNEIKVDQENMEKKNSINSHSIYSKRNYINDKAEFGNLEDFDEENTNYNNETDDNLILINEENLKAVLLDENNMINDKLVDSSTTLEIQDKLETKNLIEKNSYKNSLDDLYFSNYSNYSADETHIQNYNYENNINQKKIDNNCNEVNNSRRKSSNHENSERPNSRIKIQQNSINKNFFREKLQIMILNNENLTKNLTMNISSRKASKEEQEVKNDDFKDFKDNDVLSTNDDEDFLNEKHFYKFSNYSTNKTNKSNKSNVHINSNLPKKNSNKKNNEINLDNLEITKPIILEEKEKNSIELQEFPEYNDLLVKSISNNSQKTNEKNISEKFKSKKEENILESKVNNYIKRLTKELTNQSDNEDYYFYDNLPPRESINDDNMSKLKRFCDSCNEEHVCLICQHRKSNVMLNCYVIFLLNFFLFYNLIIL